MEKDESKNETEKAAYKPPTMKALAADQAAMDERLNSIEESLDGQRRGQAALDGKLDNILNALSDMTAKDHPTGATTAYDDALNHDLNDSAHDARFSEKGELQLEKPNVMDVEHPDFKAKAQELAFMAEVLEVEFQEVNDEDEPNTFIVYHNGRGYQFTRGNRYNIPRAVVAILCDARPISYRSTEYVDQDGVRKVKYPAKRGLRFPFSVVRDPNPRGSEWLRRSLTAA